MKRTLLGLALAALCFSACQQKAAPETTAPAGISSRQTADGLVLTAHTDWLFEPGRPDLKPVDSTLQQLARQVRLKNSQLLIVRVYTDAVGDDNANNQLAQARAEAVAAWLRRHQVSVPMEVQGLGEADPIAANTTPEGQAKNRRLEVVLR